ncbi:MAG: cysteine--tRNA ligase [Candidatus Aenigmatarchaeota archaeon]
MLLYSTLTRKKQIFKPIKGRTVLLYTCGPTVYDYAHIGNFRSFIFEDLLRRVLDLDGFKVRHVMNFTDVGHLTSDADSGEDKMQVGAEREHKTAWDIANFYIAAFKEDVKKLHLKEPEAWPRATEHIKEMIELVSTLEKRGYTYVTEDGVYFDTAKMKGYGRLAKIDARGLKAGARVDIGQKRNNTDFALWKFSLGRKRDMEWDSPWGKGFPGWHIECSAMVMKYLGETIDIHCGGVDHIAVHHTNEIAQSEAATGKRFANYWLHNEFMLVDGKKMAKSLGNYYTLKNLMEKGFSPVAFRYLCLSVHYRSQMNFTLEALEDAQNAVNSINDFVFRLGAGKDVAKNKKIESALKKCKEEFIKYINDDLDMPDALSAIFKLMKAVNREIDAGKADKKMLKAVHGFFDEINSILDVIQDQTVVLTAEEKKLLELREAFRKHRDFKAADEIRSQLKTKGIVLEDTPDGVRWRKL